MGLSGGTQDTCYNPAIIHPRIPTSRLHLALSSLRISCPLTPRRAKAFFKAPEIKVMRSHSRACGFRAGSGLRAGGVEGRGAGQVFPAADY